jgi:phage portal protein BeeE
LDVERLLVRPNPQWSSPALMYFVATSLAVANKAFLKIARGIGGSAAELWPLGPDEVQVVYHQNSRLIDYFQTNGADGRIQKHPVDDDGNSDIVFIRRPALNRQTDVSPAAVAAPSAETFNRILQRAADIAGNNSNIGGILATDGEMAEANLLEIKGKLQEYTTGERQSGGTLVTANAKWTLTKLTDDPSSALSVDIKNSLARDVCACFGVPIQLMGLPGAETAYNATVQARVGLLSDTVLPSYVNLFVAGLNHVLMPNGARIVADVDNVPTLMSWRQTLTESAQRAKFMSTNERRAMVGLARFEDQPDLPSADVPLELLELKLKQEAIRAQGGAPSNVAARLPLDEPAD